MHAKGIYTAAFTVCTVISLELVISLFEITLAIPSCRTHMQDLKDVTNNVHYENYRSKKLAAVTCNGGVDTSKTKNQMTR